MVTITRPASVSMRRSSGCEEQGIRLWNHFDGFRGVPGECGLRGPRSHSGKTSRSKLVQEPNVILIKQANIIDSVAPHAKSLDSQAEGKSGQFLGIVAHSAKNVGIDHPRPSHFNPSLAAV